MSAPFATVCPRCGERHLDGAPCPRGRSRSATPTAPIQAIGTARANGPEPAISVRGFDLSPGTVIGEYQVERKIGAGTMGVVYQGEHPLIERKVAIKVLSAELAESPDAAAQLIQEARASNRVRHQNIVDVYSIGALPDGRLYLVMELLEGRSLQQLIEQRGPLSFAEAMVIAEGALSALDAAHEAGVIHRDLKPENIFILPGPDDSLMRSTVKILDFGLAKVRTEGKSSALRTFSGLLVGTPAFMSPEQCRAVGELDARSDLYSFGVVLYFVLTGRLPFSAPSYIDVINQHLAMPPPAPSTFCDMPASVEEVILRLLEKDPARRYPNADSVRVVLKSCSDAWAWTAKMEPRRPSVELPGPFSVAMASPQSLNSLREPTPLGILNQHSSPQPLLARDVFTARLLFFVLALGGAAAVTGLVVAVSRHSQRLDRPGQVEPTEQPPLSTIHITPQTNSATTPSSPTTPTNPTNGSALTPTAMADSRPPPRPLGKSHKHGRRRHKRAKKH